MNCPHCAFELDDRPDLGGQTFACPSCGGMFTVPAPLAVTSHVPPQATSQFRFGMTAHRVMTPQSVVHVNVPKQHSNSFGNASMVLGILGLLTCWFPFFGLPLAALGALLAIFGGLASLGRSGSGLGSSIAGGFISALVLLVAGSYWYTQYKKIELMVEGAKQEQAATDRAAQDEKDRVAWPRGDRPSDQVWDFPNHPAPVAPSPAFAQGIVDANKAVATAPETIEPVAKPAAPEPKPWQAKRKWLINGKLVEGSLRSWSPAKVVIDLDDYKVVELTRDQVSLSDREWVESHFK